MNKHYYFIVEGAHDVASIGKLLKYLGMKEKRKKDEIAEVWSDNLIPEKFPFEANKLDRITPIPSFYESSEVSVAIHVAGGESKIVSSLDLTISNLRIKDLKKIDGIAVFCDADNINADEKRQLLVEQISSEEDICFNETFFNDKTGKIRGVEISSGIYVFPDNNQKGTLEKLLIECARIEYGNLLSKSQEYIDKIDLNYKNKWSGADESKVLIGSITNILKPGKSNQVSIHDNNWISETTIENSDSLNKLYNFILKFIDMNQSDKNT